MAREALELAKKLRKGQTLSFCDSMLSFENGQFSESCMRLSSYCDGHSFQEFRLSWKDVLRLLKNGAYH